MHRMPCTACHLKSAMPPSSIGDVSMVVRSYRAKMKLNRTKALHVIDRLSKLHWLDQVP